MHLPRARPFGWALVGALLGTGVLALLSIGALLLLAAAVLTVLLARRGVTRSDGAGLLAGLAAPLLLIAYLNRSGPGTVCTSFAGGQTCTEEWSPVPWLVAAVVVLVSAALLARLQRGTRH